MVHMTRIKASGSSSYWRCMRGPCLFSAMCLAVLWIILLELLDMEGLDYYDEYYQNYRPLNTSKLLPNSSSSNTILPIREPITKSNGQVQVNVKSRVTMGIPYDGLMERGIENWETVGPHGQQYLHGSYGLQPNGLPAWRPQHYVHYNTEPKPAKTLHHANFSFNKWRSDQLPLSLPRVDPRSPACRRQAEERFSFRPPHATATATSRQLPNTSVIFVAYNEPFSTLFRSVHSVLDRTPPELLHEIIIVDDGSDMQAMGEDFETYVALLPKTQLVRLPQRQGLMDARVHGAQLATGQTLTFLDSHIECMTGWLPPLLERIAADPKTVTMPVIDQINADTWEYTLGGISILGFSWAVTQTGVFRTPSPDPTQPLPSPVMAGGLFTIDRKWFFDLGAYDPEFKYWGGEEMEISWKIWQCGGRLECIPCSNVGHIFRSNKYWQGRVYSVPDGIVNRNRLRAAAVWMDPKHFKLVQDSMPPLPPNMTLGDLSKMKAIKSKLQCKSFQWYLDTVYPELFFPDMNMFQWAGEIRHVESNKCLDTLGRKKQGDALGVYPCHGQGGNQHFAGSKKNEIRVPGVGWDKCVDGNAGTPHRNVILYPCHGSKGAQLWQHDAASGQLVVLGLCLTHSGGANATLEKCANGNKNQRWKITDKRANTTTGR